MQNRFIALSRLLLPALLLVGCDLEYPLPLPPEPPADTGGDEGDPASCELRADLRRVRDGGERG